MITKKSYLSSAFLVLTALLSGCSSSTDEEQLLAANRGAEALYAQAKENMELGNFTGAAQILSSLDSRYPFGPLSHQVQLDII